MVNFTENHTLLWSKQAKQIKFATRKSQAYQVKQFESQKTRVYARKP
jgi:hypothetical protein